MPIHVRSIAAEDFEHQLPALATLLSESIHGAVSLGFLPPLSHAEAEAYWRSIQPELRTGGRLLLGAYREGCLVGTGQLSLASWPNARHRAEVHKLLVSEAQRGHGIGRAIMLALHDAARERGRSLILLNTKLGVSAEHFYMALGYQRVGVIPGYTIDPEGHRIDHATLYHELS
jgi:acetyltransferase